MKRTTIKDIALKCGVSKAVASAILGNKNGTIRYSKAKKELILKTAKEMNYTPNQLACAMTSGIVPLVAICLHVERFSSEDANFYLHDILPTGAIQLQKHGFEMIFTPFVNIDKHLERMRSLIEGGLVSGIISNFNPGTEKVVTDYLRDTGIPYIMMGKITDKSIPCVNYDSTVLKNALADYAKRNNFKKMINVLVERSSNGSSEAKYQIVNPSKHRPYEKEIDFQNKYTLFAAAGEPTTQFLLKEKKVPRKNIISVEDKKIMIHSKPSVYVRPTAAKRISKAVELLTAWIKSGNPPAKKKHYIQLKPDELEFYL